MIKDLLLVLAATWRVPRHAVHHGNETELELTCSLDTCKSDEEASDGAFGSGVHLPDQVLEFWSIASGARLFEDSVYGQWGLVLFGPNEARVRTASFIQDRGRESRKGDLMLGEFLGDQDVLLVRSDAALPDFGNVVIALPLDGRDEWPVVAQNLEEFLERFAKEQGAKFWE